MICCDPKVSKHSSFVFTLCVSCFNIYIIKIIQEILYHLNFKGLSLKA